MSAIRVYVNGRPDWLPVDDGATPLRHNRGIRGATFDNPVQVDRHVTETARDAANRQHREYKARRREGVK